MRSVRSMGFVLATAMGTAAPGLRAQPCQPYWVSGPSFPSTSFVSMTAFDDGSGPALYGIWTLSERPFRWRFGEPSWTPIQAGLPPQFGVVSSFLVLDDGNGPGLYAFGGIFSLPQMFGTARWNGASWDFVWPLTALNGSVWPKLSADLGDGMAIYGVQSFSSGTVQTIVKWTGSQWVQLGGTPNAYGFSLTKLVNGPTTTLFLSGGFTSIGGVPIVGLARWDGQRWVQAGDANGYVGFGPSVVFDDGSGPAIHAYGVMIYQGQRFDGLLKFDGQHLSVDGTVSPPGSLWGPRTVDLFDDGSGPGVYVCGSFSNFGGMPARGIARYDGAWSTLGASVSGGEVISIAHMDTPRGPSLFAIGGFTTAGGGAVRGTAQWVGCPNCYANCDLSETLPRLNVHDFLCFLNKFLVQDPYANCTVDATIDIADFACFLNKFAQGCP